LQLPAAQPASGLGDAGRLMGNYSGWRERPASAGVFQGQAARPLLAAQNAMGVGEAGAFMGSGTRAAMSAQDAMGLVA
jgi:hypothetical protein